MTRLTAEEIVAAVSEHVKNQPRISEHGETQRRIDF